MNSGNKNKISIVVNAIQYDEIWMEFSLFNMKTVKCV